MKLAPSLPGWLFGLFVFLACIGGSALIGGGAYWLVKPRMEANAARAAAVAAHAHKWGRWSDPKIAGDWFVGTQMFQTRICETCGEAETRMTQVAAGAPPK